MANDELEKYKPKDGPEDGAPVDIGEPMIPESEAIKELERVGLVNIPAKYLSAMRSIGVHLRGLGTLHFVRGQAVLNQSRLDEAMQIVGKELSKMSRRKRKSIKDMVSAAQTIGFLAQRQTYSQELMLKVEQTLAPAMRDEEEQITAAFSPGQEIRPPKGGTAILAQNVYVNGQPQKELPKASNDA